MEDIDALHTSEREFVRQDEAGQGLAEYALILGLIAVVAIAALLFLGGTINDLMDTIGTTIDTQTLN